MLFSLTIAYTLYVLIKVYASFMEIGFVLKAQKNQAIILSATNYIKAGEYKVAMQKLSILTTLYDFFIFFGWILFGLAWLDTMIAYENTILNSVVFVMLLSPLIIF